MVFDVPYTSKTSPVILYFLRLLAKVVLDHTAWQVLKQSVHGKVLGRLRTPLIKLKQPNFLKVNIKSNKNEGKLKRWQLTITYLRQQKCSLEISPATHLLFILAFEHCVRFNGVPESR